MSWTLKTFYIKDAFKPEELICSEHAMWMKTGTIEKKLKKKGKAAQDLPATHFYTRTQQLSSHYYKKGDSTYLLCIILRFLVPE